ncbi:MAG: phosphoribosylformylglycinamidine synthase subunit PurL [Actinobacteria bacterium]|nr:phosphoribosylformylglycinamidine synthase subunit PurL [Actinomycetota bacterium]
MRRRATTSDSSTGTPPATGTEGYGRLGSLRRPTRRTPLSDATTSFPADETLSAEQARELGHELGLRGDEYDRIVDTLGRVPTKSELGMYSVMWSEHCSYKSSKVHLRTLPTDGPQVLVGPGENAGVVDVGDGLAVTFKIESHNHPSYVEPYQGAATGVGGILRDIFTMGARPIAIMDPLRFGNPVTKDGRPDAHQRHIIDGVVRGVGGYGNCVGVPNIGGETVFDDCYAGNPLVNVLAVGVMPKDRLQLAVAEAPGDVAVLLGSGTGRDGIGGASVLASQEFDEGLEDKRPNVQVGDPFAEKLLIECCLELYDRDLLSGIQDMGAAGIACSTAEMASKASMGMQVDLSKVHLREPSMESWEILCSESQERMLALVSPDNLDDVLAIAEKWGVPASVIGEVVEGSALLLSRNGETVAQIPARSLADEGPTYERPMARPAWLADYVAADAESLTIPGDDLESFALGFLASPNVASKAWVHEQYDSLVLSGTVLGPGMADAGVVRLPGSRKAVAVATDGNGRWCELDPREGTKRVVAEAFRNVACVGARPLATTNCLNFGNPERPEIMWQFAESVAGLGEACDALGVPVTGGNVSLYNETRPAPDADPQAIFPTPVVGILGVLEDAEHAVDIGFEDEGDVIFLLGAPTGPGLAGSELQRHLGGPLGGRLAPVDLDVEAALAVVLIEAARQGLLHSAHDVSSGGMLANLVESCLAGDIGVTFHEGDGIPPAQALFSESPGRVVVTVPSTSVPTFARLCADAGLLMRDAGTVGGDRLVIGDLLDLDLEDVREAYTSGLPRALGEDDGPAI